jgi:hypothetical protein
MREYDDRSGQSGQEPSEEGVELIRPEDFLGPDGLPFEARLMGFDRNTEEGAMLALVGSLDGARVSHRLVAWVLLVAFVIPMLLGVSRPFLY